MVVVVVVVAEIIIFMIKNNYGDDINTKDYDDGDIN